MNMNKLNVVTLVAILGAILILAPSIGIGAQVSEAAKKKGKISASFGDVSGYQGKAKVRIWNLNTDKTIVKADLNFAKLYKSEGDNCCFKVYEFKWKGNHVGDPIGIEVGTGGTSNGWTDDSGFFKLKKGTTHIGITLDEIGE